jgi:nitronate monooxygenase
MGRPVLRTPLCDPLGIEYPILLAGMGAGNEGGAAGPELVAAVSEAGGLGVLGGTGHDVDEFHQACAQIRRLTNKPFGVELLLPALGAAGAPPAEVAKPPLPLGEGGSEGCFRADTPPSPGLRPVLSTPRGSDFLTGSQHHDASVRSEQVDKRYWDWVEATMRDLDLQEGPPRLQSGGPFTGETPAQGAARQLRHIQAIVAERPAVFAAGLGSPKQYVPALYAAGITVFGLVGNVKTARRVTADGVDVVVAQGYEAGGHTGRVGTFALVPLTAFLATPEANILPAHRQHLIDATEEDTRVTRLYSGKTARALNNPLVEAWDNSGLAALPMGLQGQVSGRLMSAARASGRDDLAMQLGGQIAGAVQEVRPAHVVLDEMVREAVDVLSALSGTRVTFAMV